MNYRVSDNDYQDQHQDMLLKEERLVKILRTMYEEALHWAPDISAEDIDFVASALGLSNYRK